MSSSLIALKFSIIMPTYQRPHTLYHTISTIRAQTYPYWELIVIDNAGNGGYQFDDPRIQVYCYADYPSASYARNQGLQYATGDVIGFFDDDDDMFPTYLEEFAAAFQAHPKAKMVRCGMVYEKVKANFGLATPECILRRAYVTPSWSREGESIQDIYYYRRIIEANGWSEEAGDIIVLRKYLLRANSDPVGGLRSGDY